ncbi:MAG TPA: hypothetical protein VFI44_04185 [Ornithinibacter sp.]|nr:hypothetical protein [Ornithinibacter sp.]
MNQLDPVGRLTPSSVDLSRAAAARHAHLSALRAPHGRPRTGSAASSRGWLHVVVARISWL